MTRLRSSVNGSTKSTNFTCIISDRGTGVPVGEQEFTKITFIFILSYFVRLWKIFGGYPKAL